MLEESFSRAQEISRGARTPCSDGDSDSEESQFDKSDLEHLSEHLGFSNIGPRYKLMRLVGQGSYGAVCLAVDNHAAGAIARTTGAAVGALGPGAAAAVPTAHQAKRAVKLVTRIFDSFEHAKR